MQLNQSGAVFRQIIWHSLQESWRQIICANNTLENASDQALVGTGLLSESGFTRCKDYWIKYMYKA